MSTGRTAREVALLALTACEQQGAWSDGFLKIAIRDAGLDGRDAGLATRLCFGVLQNRMLLDFHLSAFCKLPLETLEVRIRNILRLGAYQLLLLDRVPDSAAVNESVNLARKYSKNPRAAGMVNAVLRNLARSREDLPQPADLATRFSYPDWLVKEFDLALNGEGTEALLAADNGQPPTMAQVNTLRYTPEQVLDALRAGGVDARPHPWLPGCLLLTGTGDLEELAAFRDGAFYIQDGAARLAVLAAGPEPGMRVLDACAAPGGKSAYMCEAMNGTGRVYAWDVHGHRVDLIRAAGKRLRLYNLRPSEHDARKPYEAFDLLMNAVLVDAPCSGLGVLADKPDIRLRFSKGELAELLPLQKEILANCARFVKVGGLLVYSTCTILPEENQRQVEAFLRENPQFAPDTGDDWLPERFRPLWKDGMLQLLQHRDGVEGFFIARMRRKCL